MSLAAQLHPRAHRAPQATRRAIARAVRSGLQGLRAVPHQRLGDWAADHFKLSGDSSHRKGGWEAWPFQIGILDSFSNDDIEQVDVMKAKRVGYTKMLVAAIAYDAVHRPRKQALWQPTDDDRDSFVKSEIEPMIADVPIVAAGLRATAGADQTIRYKQFRGAVAHFLGAKAARAFRRITIASAKLDEVDGMDQQVEKSSDPITLARGRLEGAPFPKLIIGSTPRIKNLSHIEREAGQADARLRYRIACPSCGAEHPLLWDANRGPHGLKWDGVDVDSVRHVCPHCHAAIRQADYLRIWQQGAWVCDITGIRYGADRVWRSDSGQPIKPPRHIAFVELWTAYSPQRAWSDIVREFLAAQAAQDAGDSGPMQGFVNETLARTWEAAYEQTESDALRRRARAEGLPIGIVPAPACLVLAGIDVQPDRWEYVAWAVGREDETWAIDYRVIYGNTADRLEWDAKIAPLIDTTYPHAQGARVKLSALAIDTGFQTHIAYSFCRQHAKRNVYATKGDSVAGKAIKARRSLMDVNERGRLVRKGVALWFIGTDTAKDLLHGRLQLEGRGPGRVHFAAELAETFFRGLTAEIRVPVRTVRGIEHRWECPSGHRNEPLDCTVGVLFLHEVLEIRRWTALQWQRAEAALHPDLFDQPAAALQPERQQDDGDDGHADSPAAAVAPAAAEPITPARTVEPIKVASGSVAAIPPRAIPPRAPSLASSEWSSRI